jgi:hypothetical protein
MSDAPEGKARSPEDSGRSPDAVNAVVLPFGLTGVVGAMVTEVKPS